MALRRAAPAVQLHSVAQRYRRSATAWSVGQSPSSGRGWWSGGKPAVAPAPNRTSPTGRDARLQRLEAVLFAAREPLAARKLSQYANLADGTEVRTLVRRLKEIYDEGGRAFGVEEVAGGFQLLSRPKFAPWLRRLDHVPPEIRFSAPAMETLAVVAYRQPAARADIEAVRGVGCGEVLRQLMDCELVRISGRSGELGRPYLYATTKRFLQLFGLQNLDELPRAVSLRGVAAAARESEAVMEEKFTVPEEREHPEESQVSVMPPSPMQSEGSFEELLRSAAGPPRQNVDENGGQEYEGFEYEYEVEGEGEDEDEGEDKPVEEDGDGEDDEFDDDEFDDDEFDDDEFDDEEEDEEDEEDEEFDDDAWEEVDDELSEEEEEEDEEEEEEDWDDEELDWEEEDEAEEGEDEGGEEGKEGEEGEEDDEEGDWS